MSARFIAGEKQVWAALKQEAKKARRADVAVAYFGQGSANRLPLPGGSNLVVDASEPTIRAGATCPAELLKLVRDGVNVYSRPSLHAKVYVFGRTAFVGSANVSTSSADRLVEAMVRATEPDVVNAARRFVVEMAAGAPLGPEALKALQKQYRPPRTSRTGTQRQTNRRPSLWFEFVDVGEIPDGSERFVDELLGEAKKLKHRSSKYALREIWLPGQPKYAINDILVMASDNGGNDMVSPPGRVIHQKVWANGTARTTFTIVELPKSRRISMKKLAKALGYGWKSRLTNCGKLKRQFANELITWWNGRI